MRPNAWTRKFSLSSSKVMPPVTEIALVVGPIAPQTKRIRPGASNSAQASRASFAASRLISNAWSARPYSPSTSGVEPNELVSTMSAPAAR